MADVTSTLTSWSSTAASNLPANSAAVGPNTLADNQRVIQAVVRAALAGDGTIASATTTDLSTVNDGDITVSGTTTITGFGTLTAGIKKILTFSGALTLTHNATSLILPGAANITTAAGDVAIMRSLGSGNWKCVAFQPAAGNAKVGANADITSMTALTAPTVAANPIRATDLQSQLVTAFTTGGTSTAYTLTPSPATTSNAANTRLHLTFHLTAGAAPTLAVSGQTALPLKYYDATGTLQAVTSAQVTAGLKSDVVSDGTSWVVLDVASKADRGKQLFTSSGTFVVPAGVTKVWLSGAGGGGGGGNSASTYRGGGGGGASASLGDQFTVTPGQSITVTIGAGGAGGAINTYAAGSAGGSTSFGALKTWTGGSGGGAASTSAHGAGGASGGSGGAIGANGIYFGVGGSSIFGATGSPDISPSGYGAGGSGVPSGSAAAQGASGFILVEW